LLPGICAVSSKVQGSTQDPFVRCERSMRTSDLATRRASRAPALPDISDGSRRASGTIRTQLRCKKSLRALWRQSGAPPAEPEAPWRITPPFCVISQPLPLSRVSTPSEWARARTSPPSPSRSRHADSPPADLISVPRCRMAATTIDSSCSPKTSSACVQASGETPMALRWGCAAIGLFSSPRVDRRRRLSIAPSNRRATPLLLRHATLSDAGSTCPDHRRAEYAARREAPGPPDGARAPRSLILGRSDFHLPFQGAPSGT